MAWTNKQKQMAVRACQAANIDEDQRRDMVLRQFAHAHLPGGGISSTAPKLNNHDYEQFMAIVENYAGGQILHFTRNYWRDCASKQYERMRFRVRTLNTRLEAAGALTPNGQGLRGWIRSRVTKGETDELEQLDYHQLLALITQLHAYAGQRGVDLAA